MDGSNGEDDASRLDRRTFFAGAAAGVGGIAGCLRLDEGGDYDTRPVGEWPMYGRAPSNTRFHLEASGPEPPLGVDWEIEENAGRVAVGPERVYYGTDDGIVANPDGESGGWGFTAGAGVLGAPLVTEELVFFATGSGILFAVTRDDGSEVWRTGYDGNIHANPALAEGVLIASVGREVIGHDPDDGSELWSVETGGPFPALATGDGVVYGGTSASQADVDETATYAIEADGELRWTTDTENEGAVGGPGVDDDRVYARTDDGIALALDAATGDLEWSRSVGGAEPFGDVAVSDELVYVAGDDVHALDPVTGESEWTVDLESPARLLVGTSERLYAWSDGDRLSTIDREAGETVWSHRAEEFRAAAPAVVDDAIYTGSAKLHAGRPPGGGFEFEGLDARDRDRLEIAVGPDDDLAFEPERVAIEPGTAIRFVWESDNHNVVPDSLPDGVDWEGHEPLEDEGFEHEHVFEVEGEYEYVCEPHVAAGMNGSLLVTTE